MAFNFDLPFRIDFDLINGLSQQYPSSKRYLSNMKGMYCDEEARAKMEAANDQPRL